MYEEPTIEITQENYNRLLSAAVMYKLLTENLYRNAKLYYREYEKKYELSILSDDVEKILEMLDGANYQKKLSELIAKEKEKKDE